MFNFFGSKRNQRVVELAKIQGLEADVLGDKGAALARITNAELTVPNGFVITSQVSKEWGVDRTTFTPDMRSNICAAISKLEQDSGRTFFSSTPVFSSTPATAPLGQPTTATEQVASGVTKSIMSNKLPLLLSVRESPVGALCDAETVLNIGMNKSVMERMRLITGRPLFVLDTYRRFLYDWGHKMKGIPSERYQMAVDDTVKRLGLKSVHAVSGYRLSYHEMEGLVNTFEEITGDYPEDPSEQLFQALEHMYKSYFGINARSFRNSRNLRTSGTAIIVQCMVMGNLTTLSSGTGTVNSRNPQTGSNVICGKFVSRSEGADEVVHGTREIDIEHELKDRMPEVYKQLEKGARVMEKDFKDGVSLDFTLESGNVYFLNVYQSARTAEAAIKIAVDMVGSPDSISAAAKDVSAPDVLWPTKTATKAPTSVLTTGTSQPEHQPALLSKKEAILRIPVYDLASGLDPSWSRSEYCQKILAWSDDFRKMSVMANCDCVGDASASSNLKADGIGKLDIEQLIIAPRNKGIMHAFSTSLTTENRVAALRLLSANLQEQVMEILYVAPGITVVPPHKRNISEENVPISDLMTEEQREQESKFVVVNCLLFDSTTAHAFVLLPEFLEAQVSAICKAVLEAQDNLGVLFEINFTVPCLISDHELDYVLPHMQHSIEKTCKEFELAKISKQAVAEEEESKLDMPHGDAVFRTYGAGRRLFMHKPGLAQSLKCNIGVCISTPRACIRASTLVKIEAIQFAVFDVEALTEAVFRVKRGESATFMEAYLTKHILSKNPFDVLDERGVGELIKRAISDMRSSRPTFNASMQVETETSGVKCVCFGPEVENSSSIRFLQSIGMDVVSVDTTAIPMAKISAAQANVEEQFRESGKMQGWWGDAWKSLDSAMFDEGLRYMPVL